MPDFKLDAHASWVEVKAVDPTPVELAKFKELCEATCSYGLVVSGPPAERRWLLVHKEGHVADCSDWQFDACTGTDMSEFLSTDWREFEHAANAARGARFEHGESGAKRG